MEEKKLASQQQRCRARSWFANATVRSLPTAVFAGIAVLLFPCSSAFSSVAPSSFKGIAIAVAAAAAATPTASASPVSATPPSLPSTSLEARFLAKQAALQAKLQSAKDAKAAKAAKEAEEAENALYSTPVRDENGTDWGVYALPSSLPEGMHPADHVLEFSLQRELPVKIRQGLSDKVCSSLPELCGNRTRAIVTTLPVTSGGEARGRIELLDGEEATDAAYRFAATEGLTQDSYEAVRRALCTRDPRPGLIACSRDRALVYHEAASSAAPVLPLGFVPYTYQREESTEEGGNWEETEKIPWDSVVLPEDLRIWAGEEAADAIHELLVVRHGRPLEDYRRLAERVCAFNATEPHFRCSRVRIVEQVQTISLVGSADNTAAVEVLDGEEPVDSIYRFALQHGLDDNARRRLLQAICERRVDGTMQPPLAPCKRDLAVVLAGASVAHPLPASQGGGVALPGQLVIWENEEPADTVQFWWKRLVPDRHVHHPAVNETFRDQLINDICDGRKYTRPSQYDPSLRTCLQPGGMSNVLPPPPPEAWLRRENGVTPRCRRRNPVVLSIPLTDETGKNHGIFTLMGGEEPADVVFSFGARNGLSGPFRSSLLAALCNPSDNHGVARYCTRQRAQAFKRHVQVHPGYSSKDEATGEVTYPQTYGEKLSMWEDEEPADAIYRFALKFDIPLAHRQSLIWNLCTNPEYGLQCTRPFPAVFVMDVHDEKHQHKGRVEVLEGQRPADALLLHNKATKLAQVFKHPNLRRRLFHRLCGAAADAGQPMDCNVSVPRQRAVAVDLTYMGMKVVLQYFFPSFGEYSAGDGTALPDCVPLPEGLEPLDDRAEQEVARYGYDQSMVDVENRAWFPRPRGDVEQGDDNGAAKNDTVGERLRTEKESRCLSPTRAAVDFFCARLQPTPGNCMKDIHAALMGALIRDDNSRWIKSGPVGIDYYQMMRCPGDARLEEVQARLASNRVEVEALLEDVTGRVLKVAKHGKEGLASFQEARNSIVAANTSLIAARELLLSARGALSAARTSLNASHQAAIATNSALDAAWIMSEGLRGRLLQVCNETIIHRNCTRSTVLVPLSTLKDEERAEALRLEEAIARNSSYLQLDAEARREADGLPPLPSRRAASLPAIELSVIVEEEKSKDQRKDRGGGRGGADWDRSSDWDWERVRERQRERQRDMDRHWASRDWDWDRNRELDRSQNHRKDVSMNFEAAKKRRDELVQRSGDLRRTRESKENKQLPGSSSDAAFAREVDAYDTKNATAAAVGTSGDPNRLMVREIWRLCLEKPSLLEGAVLENAVIPHPKFLDDSGYQQQRLVVSEEGNVQEVSIGTADLLGSDPTFMEVPMSMWHEDALVGCDLLSRNATWVCPVARDRLPGLLPRFPVDETLTAANHLLSSLAGAINQTRHAIASALATLESGRVLMNAGRVNRAVGKASMSIARLNLAAANKTANQLGKDEELGGDSAMENAKHRSWALKQAAYDLTEGKNREFYDKPCKPVFGACCARDQADGGMNIICDGG